MLWRIFYDKNFCKHNKSNYFKIETVLQLGTLWVLGIPKKKNEYV